MNTIYDGTYVLGNTSATTYQAGPGISITQPSEGVVRISNDETLLYYNDVPGGTITLSGNPLDYEEIKMTFGSKHGSQISNNFGEDTIFYNPQDRNAILFNGVFDSNATTTGVNSFIEYFVTYTGCSGTNWTRTKSVFKAINATAWGGTESWLRNLKIVGINRISGGNA
jgi:hypothetical protein